MSEETKSPPENQGKASPTEPPKDAAEGQGSTEQYRVSLPDFEGPLDLLLHLIQKHELDILDIPIGFVAEKYLEYIKMMEELSIDLASEYLVMAATLVHIKSRMLLPPDPSQADDDEFGGEEDDPRAELIRRLLEYQKYKQAAGQLGSRSVLGRDVFARGGANDVVDGLAPLAPLSLFRLVDAFEAVLQRAKQVEEHFVDFERISISEKIAEISDRLRTKRSLRFEQLFEEDETRAEMIVTFLALLEMTKLRLTNLRQEGPLEPIFVELAVSDAEADEAAELDDAGGHPTGAETATAQTDHDDSDPEGDEAFSDGDEESELDGSDEESELDAEATDDTEPELDEVSELDAEEPEPDNEERERDNVEPEPIDAGLDAEEPEPDDAEPEPIDAALADVGASAAERDETPGAPVDPPRDDAAADENADQGDASDADPDQQN